MRANHVPVTERLRQRIAKLEARADENHVKSPSKGNPYWCCARCGIHDPERFTTSNNGRHRKGCPLQGLDAEIRHYKSLLLWVESDPMAGRKGSLPKGVSMRIIERTHRWETEAHYVSLHEVEELGCTHITILNKATQCAIDDERPTWDQAAAFLPQSLVKAGIANDAHLGPPTEKECTYDVTTGVTLDLCTDYAQSRVSWLVTSPVTKVDGFAANWGEALDCGERAANTLTMDWI